MYCAHISIMCMTLLLSDSCHLGHRLFIRHSLWIQIQFSSFRTSSAEEHKMHKEVNHRSSGWFVNLHLLVISPVKHHYHNVFMVWSRDFCNFAYVLKDTKLYHWTKINKIKINNPFPIQNQGLKEKLDDCVELTIFAGPRIVRFWDWNQAQQQWTTDLLRICIL